MNSSQLLRLLFEHIQKTNGNLKQTPPWLANAIENYTSSNDTLHPYFCRISPPMKLYLETMAANAGISMALLVEIILKVLQNDSETHKF